MTGDKKELGAYMKAISKANKKDSIATIIGVGVGISLIWSALVVLLAFLFMLVWNWIIPSVTGFSELLFWQALVMTVLYIITKKA